MSSGRVPKAAALARAGSLTPTSPVRRARSSSKVVEPAVHCAKKALSAKVFCSDALAFMRSLESESVDLIVTDPAYSGMNQHLQLGSGRIVGRYNERGGNGKWFTEFHDTPENYRSFLAECYRVLRQDRHLYIMFDSYSMLSLGALVREYFNVKNIIVWDKVNLGMGHYFRRQSELILFASKGRRPLSRRDMPDVWRVKRLYRAQYPTQKPVEVFETMILASKAVDEGGFLVCDPFVGAGSSAVAALKLGACFVGSDISEKAIEICRERLPAFLESGLDAFERCRLSRR